jgi:glutaredoxin
MVKTAFTAILVFLLCGILSDVWAQLYQYTDKHGNVVFTDKPPAGSDAKEKRLKDDGLFWSNMSEADYPSHRDSGKVPPVREEKRRDYSKETAVMYMTDWCGYCKQAKQYIRSLGAGLVEYNIDKDADRKAEMRKKSGGSSSVPLIDIDGTIIRGYSPPAIKAALDKSASK